MGWDDSEGWSGTGFDAAHGFFFSENVPVICPACREKNKDIDAFSLQERALVFSDYGKANALMRIENRGGEFFSV